MTAKEILTDLTNYDSVKSLRKNLLEMILEYLANDEIDNGQDAYTTFIILDNHLRQIGRYQRKKIKNLS
jgi:hypothetical protein